MEKKDTLEEITESKFIKELKKGLRRYRNETEQMIDILEDIERAKDKGYKIKYYYDSANDDYVWVAIDRKVGYK